MKEYLIELSGAEAFLHEHFGADVQHIQELGRGEWSVAFAYRLAGHEYVARFGLFDEDFMKDRSVAKYASERLPIPRKWRNIDILGEIERHYKTKKWELQDFHERLWCYQMHIGLDSMAYQCYTKRWDNFEWSAKRTFEVARLQ